jgi:hypothetical protein
VKLTGIGMVRNEADIIRVTVAYHLALGCDEILLVDNGSEDGTRCILRHLAEMDPCIRWSRDDGPYLQAEIMSGLAREAHGRGADWVLPFDADEFWWCRAGRLRSLLEACPAAVLRAEVINFVQARDQQHFTPRALRRMTFRAETVGNILEAGEMVTSGRIAYVQAAYPPKVVARADSSLSLAPGNHDAEGVEGEVVDTRGLVVLHAPVRSRFALEGKAETGRRMAEVYPFPLGWHGRRWDHLAQQGALDEEWRVNSQVNGELELHGVRVPLVPDFHLRTAVGPFVRRVPYQRLAQWCTDKLEGPRDLRSKVSR